VPIFLVIASEARQSVDRFVPRDDGERGGAVFFSSLRAKRGNLWIASFLAMTGKELFRFFSSLRAKRGNLWIALYLAVTVKSTGLVRASR